MTGRALIRGTCVAVGVVCVAVVLAATTSQTSLTTKADEAASSPTPDEANAPGTSTEALPAEQTSQQIPSAKLSSGGSASASSQSLPHSNGTSTPGAAPLTAVNTTTTSPKTASLSGVHSDMILLTVDKSRLTANLSTWPAVPSQTKLLKNFRIATGKAEGDKQIEGDNRTPEGIYFARRHIAGSKLPAKYGAMAIPIDFPNAIDRAQRKTGYGIWLHGVDNHQRIEEAKVTEGCVAFYNPDIARLGSWLKPHQGVVVIAESLEAVNRPEDVEEVRRLTENWLGAWSRRNIDQYISHYDGGFRYQGRNLPAYRDYKRRVFSGYRKMDVSMSDLRVLTHPKYAVALFNQDFSGDNRFKSSGRKVLYWVRAAGASGAPGAWKIRAEVFENMRFKFPTFTAAELALLSGSSSSIPSDKDSTASSL